VKLYRFVKAFSLLTLLTTYILLFSTIIAACISGGWIVITVDKYGEGLAEAALLAAMLPLHILVVSRELRDCVAPTTHPGTLNPTPIEKRGGA